jgi:hypothetical protein
VTFFCVFIYIFVNFKKHFQFDQMDLWLCVRFIGHIYILFDIFQMKKTHVCVYIYIYIYIYYISFVIFFFFGNKQLNRTNKHTTKQPSQRREERRWIISTTDGHGKGGEME